VKQKVKEKLGVKDKEFESWRFAALPMSHGKPIYLTNDNETIVHYFLGPTHYALGLEHADTSARKYRRPEKALVIHGDK
jgi:hypothetical protein